LAYSWPTRYGDTTTSRRQRGTPASKRQRVAPADDWQQLRLRLDWPEQITYELIRPAVIHVQSTAPRDEETGAAVRTIRRKADRFDAIGMASLFPAKARSDIETPDSREIPHHLRQRLIDLKIERPALRAHELATIGYVASGRRLDPRTAGRILASGLPPSRSARRFPPYKEIDDPMEPRLAIIRLHEVAYAQSRFTSSSTSEIRRDSSR
jgi:putative transposase